MNRWIILQGDVLESLATWPDESVHCVVTSPPYYGLRDYGMREQIGLEKTPHAYIEKMVAVFREVRRVLRRDGVCYVNIGDSYAAARGGTHQPAESLSGGISGKTLNGDRVNRDRHDGYNPTRNATAIGLKHKDLIGIPWMLAFALRDDGWYLRQDIIWQKPSPMPESVRDRCTKAHEYLFMLTKSPKYFYDAEAVKEPCVCTTVRKFTDGGKDKQRGHSRRHAGFNGRYAKSLEESGVPTTRNRRSVWTIATAGYKGAHFATFPEKLVEPCILSGTSEKGCCPKCGAPWSRIVNRSRKPTRPAIDSKVAGLNSIVVGNRDPQRHVTVTETAGWEPGCKCDAGDPVPCTVLDPFAGSGTTLAVAKKLGRQGIGIELNPEYVELARVRIDKAFDSNNGRLFK